MQYNRRETLKRFAVCAALLAVTGAPSARAGSRHRPSDTLAASTRYAVSVLTEIVAASGTDATPEIFRAPVDSARAVLSNAPGLDLVDDPEKKEYPMPLYTAEKYNCQVGRIRQDCALDNGLCFWVSGDQLLKGAALNAVQIAEELVK